MKRADRRLSFYCRYLSWLMLILIVALGNGIADDSHPQERLYQEPTIQPEDLEHWAFQPIQRSRSGLSDDLDAFAENRNWPKVELDRFIVQELVKHNLRPAPTASRSTLLRRLKLDLLGLPATPQEIDDFLTDEDPRAYENRVEAFLASPQFGERWAQIWLDLGRFAETDGFEHDRVRKDAWRYRDWVIRAINEDMPYDLFIEKQLAGELTGHSDDQIATMFALAGPDMPDINDQELRRHDRMNELTATIGSTLLGLQFQCAQCHDHKYDPISQADFYRLRSIFESSVPALQRDQAYFMFDRRAANRSTVGHLYFRGDVKLRGPIAQPALPRIVARSHQPFVPCEEENPRRTLIRWLFDSENPLTSRVIVNRIWQSHFGKGLFSNPSDLGVTAASPTNLQTLDWLADKLQRSHWSMKAIHRDIVLSATYRQSSRDEFAESNQTISPPWIDRITKDPNNMLYSRFPRKRLDAEVIRDSMLSISGLLNLKMGGEGVMPPLPQEVIKTLLKGQWTVSEHRSDHMRRSIYTFARRNLRYPMLDVFDRPDAGASCAKRECSTTALQALEMLNGEFSWICGQELSTHMAEPIRDSVEPRSKLQSLFRIVLGRSPTRDELIQSQEYLDRQTGSWDAKWASLVVVLMNTSEFIYLD